MINFLQYYGLTDYPALNDDFCEDIILPRTVQAAKYIALYRKLKREGFIINNRSQVAHTADQEDDQDVRDNDTVNGESNDIPSREEPVYEMAETKL